jgi:hypothetical protein
VSAPKGQFGSNHQQHLHEAGVVAQPVDFFRRQPGVLGGHDDRGPQPGLLLEPLGDLPVVYRPSHGGGPILVVDQMDAIDAVEDGVLNLPRVE